MPQTGSSITIAIASNQYHYVTPDGWRERWKTRTAKEWWAERLWRKAGGHAQETKAEKYQVHLYPIHLAGKVPPHT